MKEPYRWNYNIKIKTKDGKFEREKEIPNQQVKVKKLEKRNIKNEQGNQY